MRIYLGGYLNFYHPNKENWLAVELNGSTALSKLLTDAGIPLEEVQLVAVNGDVVDLETTFVSEGDQVKVFSPVGGGG